MKVDLKGAQAVVLPAKGKSFDATKIRKAVKDAGFTPGEVVITAEGALARKDDSLLLEMSGPVQRFVLAGGTKADELRAQSDLLGKRLRVAGKLHPSHAERPPGLAVESWTLLSPAK